MDKALSDYFDNYFDLFSSPGWKQFIEDIEGNRTLMSDLMTVKDEKELYRRQGKLEIVNLICNFQMAMDNAYKEALNDSDV